MEELRNSLLNMIDYTCNETFKTTNGLKSLKVVDEVVDI